MANFGSANNTIFIGNAISSHNNVPLRSEDRLKIFCFDISKLSKTGQFVACCVGVFVLYLIYGYLQELIFTLEGFKPYGWFLTLIQFGYYTVFGYIERRITDVASWKHRNIPLKIYLLLALLTLGTMGLSNSSLAYLNYGTQVIFKCCKLIPVLIGSILIQKKQVGPIDFLAALAMCIGLALFTVADSSISPNFDSYGVLMISLALVCDAVIGNVQEKAMKAYKAPNSEVVFFSYGLGFVYLFLIMTSTGHLFKGIKFCSHHVWDTYGLGFLFSLSGYLGIQIVLTLVRTCGATLAATVTTARKAMTIVISFLFFAKPFTIQYLWSGMIVLAGIYLNIYSKRNKMTFAEFFGKCRTLLRCENKEQLEHDRLLQNV